MVREFDNLDPNVLVYLSFEKVEDTPEGLERGRLTIQFVRPENDFVYFACHRDEVWERIVFLFNVAPENLTPQNATRVEREETLANQRVTINTLDGYIYLEECFADGLIRHDGDRWLHIHDRIVRTLMNFTKRITYPDVHEVRAHPAPPGSLPFSVPRARTIKDMPKVQIWATKDEWARLHRRVLSIPDISEMSTLSVFSSLFQVTFGMTKIFEPYDVGTGNHAICPERHTHTGGRVRILPRWIHEVCELDDMN